MAEAAPAVADPAAPPPPPPPAEPAAPAEGNAWKAARANIRTLSEEPSADTPKADEEEHPTTDAPPAKLPTQDKDAAPPGKPATEPPAKKGYELVGPEGATVAWPEGLKLRMQADGRPLEVESLDQLVTFAQKAPFFERRSNELTRDTQRLTRERDTARSETETTRREAEQILLELARDPAKYDAFRTRAEKLLDPDVLEGLEARRKLAERESADTERAREARAEEGKQFWQQQTTKVETHLSELAETYPFLQADDVPEILQGLYGIYERIAGELAEQSAPARAKFAGSDEEWADLIHQQAQEAAFAEETLADYCSKLNDRYASRVAPKRAAVEADATVREAEAHNQRTAAKLRQQELASVRSQGSPPAVTKVAEDRPTTFAGHKRGIKALFAEMKGEQSS